MPDSLPPPYMHFSHRQDAYSGAYIRAVCAVAGCDVVPSGTDNDKIDYTASSRVRGSARTKPKIDIQAKCRMGPVPEGETISYSLDIETYDNLRDPLVSNPRILVVVFAPYDETAETWIEQSETTLSLRHCGYWTTLKSLPPTENSTSQTVHLPKSNIFTPAALRLMMELTSEGRELA
jgi:hypothetical protein